MSAAPRGLSRPHASFIGTVCQGIHHCALHDNQPTNPKRARGTDAANTQRKTQNVSNWNTRLSDHHTHQPHPNRGMADTKQTNEHTHPHTAGMHPGRTNQTQRIRPMRLGSFTVRTPTTPQKRHGRCSRPLSSSQTTTTPQAPHDTNRHRTRPMGAEPHTPPKRGAWRSGNPTARTIPPPPKRAGSMISSTPAGTTPTHKGGQQAIPQTGTQHGRPAKLRRKEVIQPHLPVRLPCYDLVPITSLTLDGSPHENVVGPPASGAAHFHDLTGGVYKARERIHRGVADPRLLATPPSRSRVADCDPN